ncbi:serine O-acetyltransferase [Salinivibrio socompensis]|uniref:serine O-acetyltransferase n=1 Tax=Salinivibrio socompensis TaxID=1510206 RepID=UPI00046FF6A4|nr:serine acetyltransferase [Salinivibrio socompensis]
MINQIIKCFTRSSPPKKIKYDIEVMNHFYIKGRRRLAQHWQRRILYKYGCDIEPGVKIHPSCVFPHPIGITLGKNVVIGENVKIHQNVTIGSSPFKSGKDSMPKVKNNVTIFAGAVIAGDLIVGQGAVIGANAVVSKDVPIETTVVPARPTTII